MYQGSFEVFTAVAGLEAVVAELEAAPRTNANELATAAMQEFLGSVLVGTLPRSDPWHSPLAWHGAT